QQTRRARIPCLQGDCAAELENLQRPRQLTDCYPAQWPELKFLDDQGIDVLADDEIDAQLLGQFLKFPCHVDGIADDSEFHSLGRSNVADNDFAMIDRNTDSQLWQATFL